MTISLADRFAALKHEIDTFTKEFEAVKAEIKATGLEVIDGDYATVTVCLSSAARSTPRPPRPSSPTSRSRPAPRCS